MIDSFLKYLTYEKRYSRHTIQSYQTDLTQFDSFIQAHYETQGTEDAEHRMIRDWMVQLVESGLTSGSINRKVASLRSYYKFLMKRNSISRDPTQKIRILKSGKKIPHFVKEDEIIRLFDEYDFGTGFEGTRDKLLLELLYGTGIRLSELINLRTANVDFFDCSIKVLGKRNKERIIPLNTELINLIHHYISLKKEIFNGNGIEYLIVSNNGGKCYAMLIYRIVRKYLDLFTSIDKRSPHVLRHTFATHLLNKGAELNAVKDLLGHTSLAATQVYTHNSLEKLKKVFDQAHPKA
ncbi:MAG: tyrosine-type recombinase/integrase [Cyclobacteriaceae bacterium]|nr:tyrosine-type recombinase/integrase [Cyclobacteriaceae bacterium]